MRLWIKFLLATSVVIIICLIVVGLLAGRLIQRRFDRFVQSPQQNALQSMVPFLVNYYQSHGNSWVGLEEWLREARGRGMAQRGGGGQGFRILLLDNDRRVVADTQGEATGAVVAPEIWESGVPVTVQGQEVGRLISEARLAEARQRTLEERTFLNSIGWALLGASLAGAFAAIVVATVLALQLTAPARDLRHAAQRVASGDLDHRIEVRSNDELGEVGYAFNEMAASLARQEEIRRHMVADIAHELRTPLTVMQVELASLQDGLTEPSPETIVSLSEEVDLLSRLVDDLRLLSLMDAGQLRLELQEASVGDIMRQVVQRTQTTADRKAVSLEASVPPNLPPVQTDPDRLQQVLLNLLSNALRHTAAGGQVHISAQPEGTEVHIQVADTGEGIAPQDLPHIFDRFYRSDLSRSRTTGGSGLGLSIARGLVKAMGGEIWAESNLGEGATFHITLPRK